MICPHCRQVDGDRVIDSRQAPDGASIRRRRHCDHCDRRYTTYETSQDPMVYQEQRARAQAIAQQLRDMADKLEGLTW